MLSCLSSSFRPLNGAPSSCQVRRNGQITAHQLLVSSSTPPSCSRASKRLILLLFQTCELQYSSSSLLFTQLWTASTETVPEVLCKGRPPLVSLHSWTWAWSHPSSREMVSYSRSLVSSILRWLGDHVHPQGFWINRGNCSFLPNSALMSHVCTFQSFFFFFCLFWGCCFPPRNQI